MGKDGCVTDDEFARELRRHLTGIQRLLDRRFPQSPPVMRPDSLPR